MTTTWHHENCVQNRGVPEGLPDDLCDCATLLTFDAHAKYAKDHPALSVAGCVQLALRDARREAEMYRSRWETAMMLADHEWMTSVSALSEAEKLAQRLLDVKEVCADQRRWSDGSGQWLVPEADVLTAADGAPRKPLPNGWCASRDPHPPHDHVSATLGPLRCKGTPEPSTVPHEH